MPRNAAPGRPWKASVKPTWATNACTPSPPFARHEACARKLWHQWIHEGPTYDKLPVDISGGRKQGYRLWTYKETFPSEARGRWEVRVLTSSGQMIGKLRFTVDC